MQLDGVFEMELEVIENAIALETIDTEKTRTIKAYIPKLMPLAQAEPPKKQDVYINKNILVNDPSSLPETVYKVTVANYINVPLAGGSFYKTTIKKGAHLYIMVPNKNIKDMKVISI